MCQKFLEVFNFYYKIGPRNHSDSEHIKNKAGLHYTYCTVKPHKRCRYTNNLFCPKNRDCQNP